MMTYKGYTGVFDYDPDHEIFHGEVIGISDVITFQGRSVPELKEALQDSVEDYLDFCKELGKKPAKPFSGRFSLRLGAELHAAVARAAARGGESMNGFITKTLEGAVHQERKLEHA